MTGPTNDPWYTPPAPSQGMGLLASVKLVFWIGVVLGAAYLAVRGLEAYGSLTRRSR